MKLKLGKSGRQEVKYIILSMSFAFVWFFFLLPYFVTFNLHPVLQFMFVNIGLNMVFFLFLKAAVSKNKATLLGSLGIVILILAFDTWLPEYHVLTDGTLVKGAELGYATTDYMWGLLATTLGMQGQIVYSFTYVIMPAALLVLSAIIWPNFVKRL